MISVKCVYLHIKKKVKDNEHNKYTKCLQQQSFINILGLTNKNKIIITEQNKINSTELG